MSIIAILIFLAFSAYLITQFGNQILARDSTSWWLILLFLGIGIISPDVYHSLTRILGISLVSNFIFAAMILFLLKVTLEGAVRSTQILRKLRDAATTEAAERFAELALFRGTKSRPRVLITLPTYNEAENIRLMAELFATHGPNLDPCWEWTLCFVNDGSHDDTKLLLKRVMPKNSVSHSTNFGVSGVLITGFKAARLLDCDFVVQCDADGQHPVNQIANLLAAASTAAADLTIGSRYVERGQNYHASTTLPRRIGGQLISLGLGALGFGPGIHDPTSGFRVYSRLAIKFLVDHMPDDYPEPESIALCAMHGLTIKEFPVQMLQRQGGQTSISRSKSLEFMIKVFTALVSLRMRYFVSGGRAAR